MTHLPPSSPHTLLALITALMLSACVHAAPERRAPPPGELQGRLLYEIQLSAPGARSQGWRGVLYDEHGATLRVPPGGSIDTNLGVFVSVACRHPWDVCGMVHQQTLAGMDEHNVNVILGHEPWSYRVFVSAECTRSETWRGDLIRAGREVLDRGDRLMTPMGPFVMKTSDHAFGQHGWFPFSWPAPQPGAGHWPCHDRETAQPAESARIVYQASGTADPGFTLEMLNTGVMRLVWNGGGNRVDLPTPDPILPAWNGEIYEPRTPDHQLRVEIRHLPCRTADHQAPLPDSVTVIIDGRAMEGCGGQMRGRLEN